MAVATGTEAAERVDTVENGSTFEKIAAMAETMTDVAIAIVRTKGAGASRKAASAAKKGARKTSKGKTSIVKEIVNDSTNSHFKVDGSATAFFTKLDPNWNGVISDKGFHSFKAKNQTAVQISNSSNTGFSTVKIVDRNNYSIIFRFTDL